MDSRAQPQGSSLQNSNGARDNSAPGVGKIGEVFLVERGHGPVVVVPLGPEEHGAERLHERLAEHGVAVVDVRPVYPRLVLEEGRAVLVLVQPRVLPRGRVAVKTGETPTG